jgi:hypothetical protein
MSNYWHSKSEFWESRYIDHASYLLNLGLSKKAVAIIDSTLICWCLKGSSRRAEALSSGPFYASK